MIRNEARVMNIDPFEARRIVDEDGFNDQRKKSSNHIAFLREVTIKGEFDGGEPIRFAVYAGKSFLINGQHRMEAIASGGGTQSVVVVYSYCDTVQECALLYSRIDRGRGRSVSDALHALGMAGEGNLGHRQFLAVMSTAPLFYLELKSVAASGYKYYSKSAEGRANIMAPWMKAASEYFNAVTNAHFGNDREFVRREVVAIGIATFADKPASDKAYAFWHGMAMDDGLAATDPRKQCLEFLRKSRSKTGRSSFGVGYIAHGVTACWNAWMRGGSLKHVKVMDQKQPLKIAGTRFANRQEDGSLDMAKAPDRSAWYDTSVREVTYSAHA